ncbi:MAG: pantoate--beta-alanine ligase [Prevotellaceae bacterium]|jgi:pantoate--beta-alanine ligase|nr:pantoate--beta-alanine ligase [Prevotellaceae bacterium]
MVITSATNLVQELASFRERKTIGFVPTMGALHEGHLSLVRQAKAGSDVVVVSIFVNPTQFNNPEDLKNYPREPEADIKKLKLAGADIIFTPTEKEIYPEPDTRIFDFGAMDKVMEGFYRPGHFNGVAQVVKRLFRLVQPQLAFFGEKDFQQLAIIKALTAQEQLPLHIVACPTVREPDGLAMSSRNLLLSATQRAHAPLIYKTLQEAFGKVNSTTVPALKKWVQTTIDANPVLETEYAEIVDAHSLQPITEWNEADSIQLCIAVYAHPIRLIDNIKLK